MQKKLFFAAVIHEAFTCPSTVAANQSDLYPDPTDCRYFYQCFQNIPYRMACSDGLVFSSAQKRCDFLANVNCTVLGAEVSTTSRPTLNSLRAGKFIVQGHDTRVFMIKVR